MPKALFSVRNSCIEICAKKLNSNLQNDPVDRGTRVITQKLGPKIVVHPRNLSMSSDTERFEDSVKLLPLLSRYLNCLTVLVDTFGSCGSGNRDNYAAVSGIRMCTNPCKRELCKGHAYLLRKSLGLVDQFEILREVLSSRIISKGNTSHKARAVYTNEDWQEQDG